MIRIGLVDDDKEHQKLIRQFICRYEKEEQTKICVKEYSDGLQFLEEYEGNLDVVFLDNAAYGWNDSSKKTEGKRYWYKNYFCDEYGAVCNPWL